MAQNPYLRQLFLDKNQIVNIENLKQNRHMRVLSIKENKIQRIENIDEMHLEELCLAKNEIRAITGLTQLPFLRTLDLSHNQITFLRGLECAHSLRFLDLSLNRVEKILQLRYVEGLELLTELGLCFNPIQNKKHYRIQVLFHIPQLRMLDGVDIISEEKVKAENLHGVDSNDRKTIFTSLLPEEKFVDRRMACFEELEVESEDADEEDLSQFLSRQYASQQHASDVSGGSLARRYVGELIQRVEYGGENECQATFIM